MSFLYWVWVCLHLAAVVQCPASALESGYEVFVTDLSSISRLCGLVSNLYSAVCLGSGSLWVWLYVLGSCVGSVCSSGSRVWCKRSGIWHSGSVVCFWVWGLESEVQILAQDPLWSPGFTVQALCPRSNLALKSDVCQPLVIVTATRSFQVGVQWRRKLYSMQIAQLWYSMTMRTAQLLTSSILLQMNYEAAQLWTSSVVLLLTSEASWLWGGPTGKAVLETALLHKFLSSFAFLLYSPPSRCLHQSVQWERKYGDQW